MNLTISLVGVSVFLTIATRGYEILTFVNKIVAALAMQ